MFQNRSICTSRYVDDVTFICACGGTMKRTPELIDVWFDSGSMQFAQWHYPFENKETIRKVIILLILFLKASIRRADGFTRFIPSARFYSINRLLKMSLSTN